MNNNLVVSLSGYNILYFIDLVNSFFNENYVYPSKETNSNI